MLLSVLSRRRDFQKPDLLGVLSALLGEAQIVCGVLELAYYRLQEMMGGLSPPESITGF